MKKILLPGLLCAMFVVGTSAEVKVSVTPLKSQTSSAIKKAAGINGKAALPMKKVVSTADILVSQDFSDLKTPFVEGPVSSYYFPQELLNTPLEDMETNEIPADLMGGQEGWKGDYVFSNDGSCVIQTSGAGSQHQSYLYTPQNDYSGSLTISFIAKSLPTYWYTYNDEGKEVKNRYTGSSINVGIFTESDRDVELIGASAYEFASVRLYEGQGWCEVKIEIDNMSAYNDAFISFSTAETVAIDDIKITSSVDNFIAPPALESVTDVTETSFTINLEPVRKSFNYYVYLFTLKGYDDNGAPIFLPVLTKQDLEDAAIYAEYYGMTLEEYLEAYYESFDINNPYSGYYGMINSGTSYTFTDLDPAEQYYFGYRSHFVTKFSDLVIYEQSILPTPANLQAVKDGEDAFTAGWDAVTKADLYYVSLMGVESATQDTDEYYILEDNFDKSEGIGSLENPKNLDSEDETSFDPYSDMQGWETYYGEPLVADGAIGINGYGAAIVSPYLYFKGAETVTVVARVVANDPEVYAFYLGCGSNFEVCYLEDGVWEGTLTFPTEGAEWGYIQFIDIMDGPIFVDNAAVMRDVEAGETIYTYLQSDYVEDGTSISYTGLNTDMFSTFGFSVMAVQEAPEGYRTSAQSEIKTIDLVAGGNGVTNITDMNTENAAEIEAIYNTTGQKVDAFTKGINIVRYSNGVTKKVMIK